MEKQAFQGKKKKQEKDFFFLDWSQITKQIPDLNLLVILQYLKHQVFITDNLGHYCSSSKAQVEMSRTLGFTWWDSIPVEMSTHLKSCWKNVKLNFIKLSAHFWYVDQINNNLSAAVIYSILPI